MLVAFPLELCERSWNPEVGSDLNRCSVLEHDWIKARKRNLHIEKHLDAFAEGKLLCDEIAHGVVFKEKAFALLLGTHVFFLRLRYRGTCLSCLKLFPTLAYCDPTSGNSMKLASLGAW